MFFKLIKTILLIIISTKPIIALAPNNLGNPTQKRVLRSLLSDHFSNDLPTHTEKDIHDFYKIPTDAPIQIKLFFSNNQTLCIKGIDDKNALKDIMPQHIHPEDHKLILSFKTTESRNAFLRDVFSYDLSSPLPLDYILTDTCLKLPLDNLKKPEGWTPEEELLKMLYPNYRFIGRNLSKNRNEMYFMDHGRNNLYLIKSSSETHSYNDLREKFMKTQLLLACGLPLPETDLILGKDYHLYIKEKCRPGLVSLNNLDVHKKLDQSALLKTFLKCAFFGISTENIMFIWDNACKIYKPALPYIEDFFPEKIQETWSGISTFADIKSYLEGFSQQKSNPLIYNIIAKNNNDDHILDTLKELCQLLNCYSMKDNVCLNPHLAKTLEILKKIAEQESWAIPMTFSDPSNLTIQTIQLKLNIHSYPHLQQLLSSIQLKSISFIANVNNRSNLAIRNENDFKKYYALLASLNITTPETYQYFYEKVLLDA